MSDENWDLTELKDETTTSLTVSDIEQLLFTRGVKRKYLKGEKSDLITLLKNNYSPTLPDKQIQSLTIFHIQPECKLWSIDCKGWSHTDELVSRLLNKDINQWLTLAAPNVKCNGPNVKLRIIKINDNEFCVAFVEDDKITYISKYNTQQNNWKSWFINYSFTDTAVKFSFNDIDKLIYIYFQTNGILLKINFETKEIIKVTQGFSLTGVNGCTTDCIFNNNKLHIAGGKHLILDVNGSNKFDECSSFKTVTDNSRTGKLIGNIGSTNIFYGTSAGMLYSYNSIFNEWVALRMDSPWMNNYAPVVITGDERYMLVFRNRKIHILNLENKTWRISAIVCPLDRGGNAVITRNNLRSELITFGFVRKCWRDFEIGEDLFPPQYIVKLMQLWSAEEYVHVIYGNLYDWDNRQYHWTMNVEYIINNRQ